MRSENLHKRNNLATNAKDHRKKYCKPAIIEDIIFTRWALACAKAEVEFCGATLQSP